MSFVSEGVSLIHKKPVEGGHRYEMWTVQSVRKLKDGTLKAKLIAGTETFSAVAQATFKPGADFGNWRVLPERDKAFRRLCHELFESSPAPALAATEEAAPDAR